MTDKPLIIHLVGMAALVAVAVVQVADSLTADWLLQGKERTAAAVGRTTVARAVV
jgi:hypothetical protein